MNNDSTSGTGYYVYKNGTIYEGKRVASLQQGFGTLTYPTGTVFQGEWVNGVMVNGSRMHNNVTTYTGEWQDTLYHGKGTHYTSKYVYEGRFDMGLYHGPGRITYYDVVNTVPSDVISSVFGSTTTPTPTTTTSDATTTNTNTNAHYSGSGINSNISMIGIPSTSANNDGIIGGDGGTTNRVVEDCNIIVRYPCQGHHYFHAHCLHSWLQVSALFTSFCCGVGIVIIVIV